MEIDIKYKDNAVFQPVMELVAKELRVDIDQLSTDIGVGDIPEWDSVANLVLLQAIEVKFVIVLDIDDMLRIETIGDIISVVSELYQK